MPPPDSLSRVRRALRAAAEPRFDLPGWTVVADASMDDDGYDENWGVLATRGEQWVAVSFFMSLAGAYCFTGASDEHTTLPSVRAVLYVIEHPCRFCPGRKAPTWETLVGVGA